MNMFSSFKPHYEPKGLNINPYTMAYRWKDLLTRKYYDRFFKTTLVKMAACEVDNLSNFDSLPFRIVLIL